MVNLYDFFTYIGANNMIDFSLNMYQKISYATGVKWSKKRKSMEWTPPKIYQRVYIFNVWTPFLKELRTNKVKAFNKVVRLTDRPLKGGFK